MQSLVIEDTAEADPLPQEPFPLAGPWARRISAVQGAVTAKRHLLDALWLSDYGCELGFSIGVNSVKLGFFVGRRALQAAAGLRSFANDSRRSLCTVVTALALPGAALGGLALFGVLILASAGRAAQCAIDVAPLACWPFGGACLFLGLGGLTMLPAEVPTYKVLRFLDEVLWFADVVTWASLSFSRKTTHVCIRGAGEALGVLGHVDLGATLGIVKDSTTHALLSQNMITKLSAIAQMFSEYTAHAADEIRMPELLLAVKALAQLQSVAGREPEGELRSIEDVDGGADVRRLVWFAVGMHGHAGLKFLGAINYGTVGSDLEALAFCASIPPSDILLCEWRGQLHIPGYALALDRSTSTIVLAIRGTLWPQDWVTDLDCRPRSCQLAGQQGFAHAGMLTAAENLSSALAPVVSSLLSSKTYSGYRFVLTGHSLGAGVAALLSAMWMSPTSPLGTAAERVTCVAFGMPSVASPHLGRALRHRITAVVCAHDFVPRFSLSSSVRLRDAALRLWRRPGASAALLEQYRQAATAAAGGTLGEQARRAAASELAELMDGGDGNDAGAAEGNNGSVTEALCPLGRVLWAAPSGRGGGIKEVPEPGAFFCDIPLGSAKDIFEPHLPQNYAARLGGGAGPVTAAA